MAFGLAVFGGAPGAAQELLREADAAAQLRLRPALGRGRAAGLALRVVNVGDLPVHLAGVELSARFVDGSPAGRVERLGRMPERLAPGRSAWVRYRWRRPKAEADARGPVLFVGCVAIEENDVDPSNDCDLELRGRRPHAEVLVIDDRFDAWHPYWERWSSGTGSDALADGIARFTISAASHSGEYSDAEINDYRRGPEQGFPWRPGVRVELRARASDDNGTFSGEGKGTRGFGFWNLDTRGPGTVGGMSNAWFISLSKETVGGDFGLFAAVVFVRGSAVLFQPLLVDMRQWHTYGIVWTGGGVTFSVDGRPVAATPQAPDEPLGLVAWIDNYRITFGPGGVETDFLDLDRDQSLFLDELRIWSLVGAGRRVRAGWARR